MDAVLLDLDGVIYQGESALPGALATLEWLQHENIPHLFLTNTTSRPASAVISKLVDMGIAITPDQLLTPVIVARHWLEDQGSTSVACLLAEQSLEDLGGLDLLTYPDQAEVKAVIVGDLAEDWTYDRLNWGFRLLMENPKSHLVALGMTRYCRSGAQLRLDVAPFVSALQSATDRDPKVTGKPGKLMFEAGLSMLGVKADQAVMLGDDIRSDIGGALDAGLKGVLVQTGKFRTEDLSDDLSPTAVIPSIADLPDWYQSNQ